MAKDRNIVSKLLSFITYKKKKEIKKFIIPEINEGDHSTENEEDGKSTKSPQNKTYEEKPKKSVKKPTTVLPINEQKSDKNKTADDKTISTDIKTNIDYINMKFNSPVNKDIVIREFNIKGEFKSFIAYLDGMVDRATINNFILRPLLKDENFKDVKELCQFDYILKNVIETNQTKKVISPNDLIIEILSGNTCLYIDGCDYYISSETKGYEKRSVTTPQTEGVVKGPQEGFTENLRTNITLIRKIIKNNNLTTEFINVGETTNTLCAIMYINGVVNPAIVKEVKRRISSIKTDALFSSGMLEQFIEESPWSIVPTVLSTERPDRTASHISEGRVGVFVDGTPFTFLVPVTLHSLFHSSEDAALKWQFATLIRYIRLLAVVLATLLPGLYVAITTFHKEMIPTDLLIAIAKAKENVPFPTVVELLLMEIAFELIREAGIRVPGIVGNTIGIIGALILGQAAVEANIVSPVLIIVIAVTGLGNFTIPNFSLAFTVRILRFIFIFAGSFLGFFGISATLVLTGTFIVNMKSFGIPFYSSTVPKTRKSFDLLARWPVWKQELRPDTINPLDERKQPKVSKGWTQENPENNTEKGGSKDE